MAQPSARALHPRARLTGSASAASSRNCRSAPILAPGECPAHPSEARRAGLEKRAAALISGMLAEIFPGNRIDVRRPVSDLSIGERQMIEIARAFTESDGPAKIVILDEPTSSLDTSAAAQLLAFLGRAASKGRACILITHKLNEVLEHTKRIVVMKDGSIAADVPALGLSRDQLFDLMGAVDRGSSGDRRPPNSAGSGGSNCPAHLRTPTLQVEAGEVVGLAGLAGHGQKETLQRASIALLGRPRQGLQVAGRWPMSAAIAEGRAYFPSGRSLSTSQSPAFAVSRIRASSPPPEARLAENWRQQDIGIRSASCGAIDPGSQRRQPSKGSGRARLRHRFGNYLVR